MSEEIKGFVENRPRLLRVWTGPYCGMAPAELDPEKEIVLLAAETEISVQILDNTGLVSGPVFRFPATTTIKEVLEVVEELTPPFLDKMIEDLKKRMAELKKMAEEEDNSHE